MIEIRKNDLSVEEYYEFSGGNVMKVLAIILYIVALCAWIISIISIYYRSATMGIGALFLCLGTFVMVVDKKREIK